MNTGRGAHLPLDKNGPDSFFCYVRHATPPPQQARNFLALPVPIYTPGSRGVNYYGKVPYSRIQHVGRNGL